MLVAYKTDTIIKDFLYLGRIDIKSDKLGESEFKFGDDINNYKLEGISNKNILFKQNIKNVNTDESYLSYISYI